MAKDFYDVLGVSRTASAEEIKSAYRRLSKELHPDRHQGDKEKERKYQEVNEAYEILGNAEKRKRYDQFGAAGAGGGPGAAGFDFSGFSDQEFGGFSDIFESFFGGAGGPRQRRQDRRGQDMEIRLAITFAEAVSGAQQEVSLERELACDQCDGSGVEPGSKKITCPECQGTGQVTRTMQSFFGTIQQSQVCPRCEGAGQVPENACTRCNGKGRQRRTDTVTIDIPAGIANGQSLRIRGEGQAGLQGAPAGDLFVHIQVEPDPRFTRDGDDIRSTMNLSVIDALLGAEKEVETVHGKTKMKIPEGAQPGQVLRLKDKGMPVLGSPSRHGHHYVELRVEIPKKLSRKERKLIEQWHELQ